MKRIRSTRENGLKPSAFRSEAPNRATPITAAAPASKCAHSTQLVDTQLVAEAQRLEEVFVRTNPAPALSEEEIAFDESLKEGEYLVAARKAREDVFADPRSPEAAKMARPYATPNTLPPESGVVTAPLQSQTDNEQLGEQFAVLNQELKRISNLASGKRRFSEEDARKGFPAFHLWDVLDNSNIDSSTRSDWFTNSCQRFGDQEGRFDFIGKLTGRSSATAYDIYKERPSRKKRSLH